MTYSYADAHQTKLFINAFEDPSKDLFCWSNLNFAFKRILVEYNVFFLFDFTNLRDSRTWAFS